MDKVVFLDTNGWIALLNSRDALHRKADEIWRRLGSNGYSVLVTDWVVAETGNGVASGPGRKALAQAVAAVQQISRTKLVFATDCLLDND